MKNIYSKLFLIVTIIIVTTFFAKAQESDTLEIQYNENGKIKFARFKQNTNSNRKMQNDITFLKSILQTKNEDGFKNVKEWVDELGFTHKKFQQYYNGIKVENAEYLVHGKGGNIETINGDFQNMKNISSNNPQLSEQQALTKALTFVGAKKYKWEDAAMENFIKQQKNNTQATYYPKGELVIVKDILKGSNTYKLAWKFTISSLNPNNEQLIYVDANNGDIINNIPLILNNNVPCVAQTRYSGTLNITGDTYTGPGGFRLQEIRNNVNIQTLNLHNSAIYANGTDFTNTNTNWIAGNWAGFAQDQVALDAHWGAEMVLDFWRITFNRNSLNGNGLPITSYVHHSPDPGEAFWDGNGLAMNYTDGDINFLPLTALDVCGHEMGHGITQFTSGLTPGTAESGALNEGFSDIWGTCVEHFAAPNKPLWLIGREVMANGNTCLRNMQNPKDPNALTHGPDTYHGINWDNNGEPHQNSTVLSHWFFLLSQGGNGTNDLGNAYIVNAIGIDQAQRIAYRTESAGYLTPTADYAAIRTASIQAARDLYGAGSCQEIAVTNAWYAVGVGGNYTNGYTINPNADLCTSGVYTVNAPIGSIVTWNVNPLGVVGFSPNGSSVTLTKQTSGQIVLTASFTDACGGLISVSKTIFVGGDAVGYYTINASTTQNNLVNGSGSFITAQRGQNVYIHFQLTANNLSSVVWSYDNVTGSGNLFNASFTAPLTGYTNMYKTVYLNATSPCGVMQNYFPFTIMSLGWTYAMIASPNPATANINLAISTVADTATTTSIAPVAKAMTLDNSTKMYLYDFNTSSLVKQWSFPENKILNYNLNIAGIKQGVYILKMQRDNKIANTKIIIQ